MKWKIDFRLWKSKKLSQQQKFPLPSRDEFNWDIIGIAFKWKTRSTWKTPSRLNHSFSPHSPQFRWPRNDLEYFSRIARIAPAPPTPKN